MRYLREKTLTWLCTFLVWPTLCAFREGRGWSCGSLRSDDCFLAFMEGSSHVFQLNSGNNNQRALRPPWSSFPAVWPLPVKIKADTQKHALTWQKKKDVCRETATTDHSLSHAAPLYSCSLLLRMHPMTPVGLRAAMIDFFAKYLQPDRLYLCVGGTFFSFFFCPKCANVTLWKEFTKLFYQIRTFNGGMHCCLLSERRVCVCVFHMNSSSSLHTRVLWKIRANHSCVRDGENTALWKVNSIWVTRSDKQTNKQNPGSACILSQNICLVILCHGEKERERKQLSRNEQTALVEICALMSYMSH